MMQLLIDGAAVARGVGGTAIGWVQVTRLEPQVVV
jgi:hypothetical protein